MICDCRSFILSLRRKGKRAGQRDYGEYKIRIPVQSDRSSRFFSGIPH